MKRRRWTPAIVARLLREYADTPTWKIARAVKRPLHQVYAKAAKLGLHKSAEYRAGPHAYRLRRGDNVGAAFRFKPGHVPANKGLRRPGWGPGRMKETQFKKGQVGKRWDPEIYCIGALRINADGYLDIKLRNGLRGWSELGRWTWETERGPIPPGMVVRAINGDRHDTRIENLRLASRPELIRENNVHNLPKPLARAIQLRGALVRRINKLEERNAEDS